MGRAIGKLSAIAIDKMTAKGRHSDGGGLYLSVSSAGTKSWVFMWSRGGRRREMGLGPYPAISLQSARKKAADCRTAVAEGLDPIVERDRLQQKSFGECADLYIEIMEPTWRNEKHRYQWRQTLTDYCSPIRSRPVSSIGTEDVLMILKPIWTDKYETASRLRGRIERVLDFAKTKGWRTGENPARWRGHLQNILPGPKSGQQAHLPAMDYCELPAFMKRLRAREALSARALEFAILTGARTSEVLKAKWLEIDLDAGTWTVPAERMKGEEEHVVPLSEPALDILKPLAQARTSKFVFPGQKSGQPLSDMVMLMLLRRLKIDEACVHGFRSSFRDWAGDETSFPRELIEAALAHKIGNAVERAYRRRTAIDKRRKLMQAWSNYCCSRVGENVVAMRRREGNHSSRETA